jgi:electron transfer flavoprotein alpha subunit
MKINTELCSGCGACVAACPFGALVLKDNKAEKTELCTDCGACASACAFDAIQAKESSDSKVDKVVDINSYKGVWVYLEVKDGQLRGVALELLAQGRKLADEMGQELAGVLLGDNVADLANEAFANGADKIYLVEDPCYGHYDADLYTAALTELINTYHPSVILLGATHNGRDLAPRVAARVKTGLTADCTGLSIDAETGLVAWTRPAFGGNIMATIFCPNHRPQMGTVRPRVFRRAEPDCERTGTIVRVTPKATTSRVKWIETIKSLKEAVNLEDAEIIVAGGRGMGKPESFALITELAGLLGGAVGASRAVVDAGWISADHQVGQTGKTVAPRVYIACGISGAIQHLAGMQGADVIIAINRDASAPIFSVAHYGIVGDVNEVLPALINEIRDSQNSERGMQCVRMDAAATR